MMTNNKKAVSLLEIMIGVLLLALILVPSLNVVISQTQTVTATRDHSQAAFLAEKIIETARSFPFNLLDSDRYESNSEDYKKTFEYKLWNDEKYNTYELNNIKYTISTDKEYTSIDSISNKGAATDELPKIYAFKYRIIYTGKDGREHHLDVHTALSSR